MALTNKDAECLNHSVWFLLLSYSDLPKLFVQLHRTVVSEEWYDSSLFRVRVPVLSRLVPLRIKKGIVTIKEKLFEIVSLQTGDHGGG